MRTSSLRFAAAFALAVGLLGAEASAKALEVARVQNVSGRVTINKGARVGPSTQFKEGDVIDVSSGARARIEFEDQSYLELVGPTRLEFVQITAEGRRVKLHSGMVTEAFIRGIALEIQTPYDASLVLQNATASARVIPGDKVTFTRRDGMYLKVHTGGPEGEDLRTTWTLNVRGERATGPTPGTGAPGEGRIQLGRRTITYKPASQFDVQQTPNGRTRLTYNGDDFGQVVVGTDTVLFLQPGEYVEFNEHGYVQNFTGISHLYHPLTDDAFYDEPVENAADASPKKKRKR